MGNDEPRAPLHCARDCAAMLRAAMRLPLILGAAALLSSCAPQPIADDEGNASFAREAIKMLLGRPARGYDEVKLVGDIAHLYGREAAAKILMKEPEFVENWTHVLIDLLQIQREGGNLLAAQDKDCWGAPKRLTPDPAIARWVRDHAPDFAGPDQDGTTRPQNWNMVDLLNSAIALDDLSPVYRAYLFPLLMRRADWDAGQDEGRRDQLATRFLRVYLNRDPICLGCHNPTYSASNKTVNNVTWTRLWSIPGHAEKALFGDYFNAPAVRASVWALMRGDVRKSNHPIATSFGIQPWGMEQSCARDSPNDWQDNDPVAWVPQGAPQAYTRLGFQPPVANSFDDTHPPSARFGSLQRDPSQNIANRMSVWELESALKTGVETLKTSGYVRQPPPQSTTTTPLYCTVAKEFRKLGCTSMCHTGTTPTAGLNLAVTNSASQLVNVAAQSPHHTKQTRVVPVTSAQVLLDDSELWQRVKTPTTADSMPPGGATATAQDDLKNAVSAWISAGAPVIPDTSACVDSQLPDVQPDPAFAFMTAVNLVDGIWMAAMGERLTIAHGYPRNSDQNEMLWNLTEFEFLQNNWSLQTVLTRIVTSKWYARRAPSDSPLNSAYWLQPILDPWIVADPTAGGATTNRDHYNGQGELVDRFRVSVLLRNIAAALGWNKPPTMPASWQPPYPADLAMALGQPISPQHQGFEGINFQSLLALEAEAGLCKKANHTSGNDWIDEVVSKINNFNSNLQSGATPISFADAWMMLKDRLIQDPTINSIRPSELAANGPDEFQAFGTFLSAKMSGAAPGTPATFLGTSNLESMLREACGILVKSPQFVLANITPKTYSIWAPGALRLNVCLPGEPCGYAQICAHYRQVLGTMGYSLGCSSRSVYNDTPMTVDTGTNEMGRIAGPSRTQTWTALTRQASHAPAPLRLSSPPPPSAGEAEYDLPAAVRPRARLQGLARVGQRLATLCPGGLCGFVARPAPSVARCLEAPRDNVCRVLFPACDPRAQGVAGSCGSLPADFAASGVLAVWAEGAEVKSAANARLLRSGEQRWQPLQAGAKLQAGDLIDLPFTASLRVKADNVTFGDDAMADTRVSALRGHLLAVTGPSAEKLLAIPPRRGALSAADLIKGVQSGAYRSRVMTEADVRRNAPLPTLHVGQPPLSREEIMKRNAPFAELHRGFPPERPPAKGPPR